MIEEDRGKLLYRGGGERRRRRRREEDDERGDEMRRERERAICLRRRKVSVCVCVFFQVFSKGKKPESPCVDSTRAIGVRWVIFCS